MISTLSHSKFIQYQVAFERSIRQTPAEATLILTKNIVSTGEFTDFTGESGRGEVRHTIKCLYKRDFSRSERIKQGIEEEVSGVVYLSPRDLMDTLGTFKLDKFKTRVVLNDIEYIVGSTIYRAPFYNSCIAVELRLRDKNKL